MKRFHIHVMVNDLNKNIEFYSQLFGQKPSKQKSDYAKWMLNDPAINFAISLSNTESGINHLGIQVDDEKALGILKQQARMASEKDLFVEGQVNCCHARSDKHWTRDPQGIAWEHYLTLHDIESPEALGEKDHESCCIPLAGTDNTPCCVPENKSQSAICCE